MSRLGYYLSENDFCLIYRVSYLVYFQYTLCFGKDGDFGLRGAPPSTPKANFLLSSACGNCVAMQCWRPCWYQEDCGHMI